MSSVKDKQKYRQAHTCFTDGHSVIANLLLRAAYGVK